MAWNDQKDFTYNFTNHPSECGETYPVHFFTSFFLALGAAGCAIMLLIHAVFPFWFEKDGGNGLILLAKAIEGKREECGKTETGEVSPGE